MRARNARNGKLLAAHVERTFGGGRAARGLLGKAGIEQGHALWILGSMGVHSFGMRFAIDVAYLDGDLCVFHVIPRMKPNRVGRISFRSESVLELPAGTLQASDTRVGDRLVFEDRGDEPAKPVRPAEPDPVMPPEGS